MAKVVADEIAEKKFTPIRLEIILETKKEAETLGKLANCGRVHDSIQSVYGREGCDVLTKIYEVLQLRGVDINGTGILNLAWAGGKC